MIPAILAHGGAGARIEDSDGPHAACVAGLALLAARGPDAALAAVIAAACHLEDDPRFNAGTGSNLRMDGTLEQDALLAASDGRIGAVACLESTKHPILVAQAVMADSPHIMLCGQGATKFARANGFPYFDCATAKSHERYKAALARIASGELRPTENKWSGRGPTGLRKPPGMRGTIGAVARAADGTFAVSNSTGGTSMMMPGRIGDSPVFGAGTYVGAKGAVCGTGDGEEVIRRMCCLRVYDRIAAGEHPQTACEIEVRAFPEPYVLGLIAVSATADGWAATKGVMAQGAARGS
jgi:beta-aspartyl-peptidase (threonine type)